MSEDTRAFKPDTKLIAITGKDLDEILFEFDQIIEKPVIINNLLTAIEKCIGLDCKKMIETPAKTIVVSQRF
jgi:hypothetical protein